MCEDRAVMISSKLTQVCILKPRRSSCSYYWCRHGSSSSGLVKPRVVIVGSGWGGFRVAKDIDKTKFSVTVVSPRNHFLFTPLLPSTTVGTLEFRCAQEPVRTIKDIHYV